MQFLRGPIRKKLFFIVILATIPVLSVMLLQQVDRRQKDIRAAKQDVRTFLHGFSEVQRTVTTSSKALLQTIAALPEIRNKEPEKSTVILSTLLKTNPIFTNVFLLNLDGSVIAMGKGKDTGFNFADRKQFRDALTSGEFAAGEFIIGRQTKISAFPFGIPVFDNAGKRTGAIILGTNLNRYNKLFNDSDLPPGAFFGLCDHQGIRLMRIPSTEHTPRGVPVKSEVFEAARDADGPGTVEAITTDKVDRIIAFEPIRMAPDKSPYMYMFMGLNKDFVVADANEEMLKGGILGALSLCFALGVTWLLGHTALVSRIERLTRAATRFGRGATTARSGVDYSDGEIGQLGQAFDSMTTLLCKREEDLREAKDSAEAANKTKSEFLANMSHEIRTPLNGVMGMLQLISKTPLNHEQQEYAAHALNASRRLLRLLTDILDLSKIEAGKLDISMRLFDLRDAVEGVVQLFNPLAKEKELELRVQINPDIPGTLCGDYARVQQVLSNLLGNAIKFTNKGHITINVHPLPQINHQEQRILFSILDTGIGISDEVLERLFTPFTQAEGDFTRSFQGAGLGLTISKRLVGLMGGNMSVVSEEGMGSTFLFCIPFTVATQEKCEHEVDKEYEQVKSLHVLVAEDDLTSRIVAVRHLEKLGNHVQAVDDGENTLAQLRETSFDLVLMDVQMPTLDGVDATKAIRRGEAGQQNTNIPIIAMTAYSMVGDMDLFLEAGMNGYVAKPVEMDKLQTEIRHVLEKGRNNN